MPQRIDDELENKRAAGETPRIIEVGDNLHEELHEEINPPLIAAIVGPYDKAPVHTDIEVTTYRDLPVLLIAGFGADYLNIVTDKE